MKITIDADKWPLTADGKLICLGDTVHIKSELRWDESLEMEVTSISLVEDHMRDHYEGNFVIGNVEFDVGNEECYSTRNSYLESQTTA